MNLETLNDMWEKDSQLNDEKLDHDSLEIPRLHAKYLRLYNTFTTLRDQGESVSYTHLTLPTILRV